MKRNPIQFAVVREDPNIEIELVKATKADKVLLIGSGGCTAFTLQAVIPDVKITLADVNPMQIDLVKRKAAALKNLKGDQRKDAFNIENDDPKGLNACGNFESLFRCFRNFIFEFVLAKQDVENLFALKLEPHVLFSSPYWPVAFDLHFHQQFLVAMFGPDAVQHGQTESYPAYFRKIIERGLSSSLRKNNYFLHHIFLGHYIDEPDSLPAYLKSSKTDYVFDYVTGEIATIKDLKSFDLISISNILDWSSEEKCKALANFLISHTRADTTLIFRQLNNTKDFYQLFEPSFKFDKKLGKNLLANDRSLFYSRLNIGVRT